jgi:nucleoside-diphosphate-sugar epimerase
MNKQNIWVLGSTGYVGKSIMHSLIQDFIPEGHMVSPIIHKALAPPEFEGCNTLSGSLQNFNSFWLKKFPPSGLIHAARMAGANPLLRALAAQRGLHGNKKWLAMLSDLDKTPPIVYVSGTLVYGNLNKGQVAHEGYPLNPTAFAKHYSKAEQPFENARYKLDIRMVRPPWIIGPSSWFYHFFYKPAMQSGFVPIYGEGNQLMSLIHIADCGKMIVHALRNGMPSTNYNIFAAPPISQAEFSHLVAGFLNLKCDYATKKSHFLKREQLEALTSNTPVKTNHNDWFASFDFKFPNVPAMIEDVILQLSDL